MTREKPYFTDVYHSVQLPSFTWTWQTKIFCNNVRSPISAKSNYFRFPWIFKDFFNKPGYNFDDVSKNGYPRFSGNNGTLE